MRIGTYDDPGPPLTVRFLAGDRVVSSGSLKAGWKQGDVDIPITPVTADTQADRMCVHDGGLVRLAFAGEPTGLLREESCWHFRDTYLDISDDEHVEAMRAGVKLAASRGVTAVHDKDGWIGAFRFWQRLEAEGALTLRVWQSLPAEKAPELEAVDARSGLGSPLLRLGYLKAFMDGTLGSQTARMLDGSGVEITSGEELAELIRAGARAGFPMAVHAIGDLANRDALDAFEETRDEWQPRGLRPRIEHAQLLAADDLGRFAELGVAASVQFSHAPSDRDLADRFWGDLESEPYAFRSLLDSGAVVANGSDAPIEELDPLLGIRAGARRTLDDRAAWHPEQALTVEQALEATCVTPAWLSGDEHRRGKLLPGYYADLVVLDRDPLACEPEELAEVSVVATMLGGGWTHNPPPWD
jgi:predicted amidohydrolase YtcJ